MDLFRGNDRLDVSARGSKALRRMLSGCADLLLPRPCACCELPLASGEAGLCPGCLDELPGRHAQRCRICAIRLQQPQASGEVTHRDISPATDALRASPVPADLTATDLIPADLCPICASYPPAWEAAWVLGDYAAPLDRVLVAAKFHNRPSLARSLGASLGWICRNAFQGNDRMEHPPWLTAVPLGQTRWRDRGYNQTEAMAAGVASQLDAVKPDRLLRRVRETAAQSGLSESERRDNLRGAFECLRPLDGRPVLLVDDVMTTGATLEAACDALLRADAGDITVLVAARTPAPGERAGCVV